MQPALKIYEMALAQGDKGNLHVTLYSPPERARLKGIVLLVHQYGENADRYRIFAKEALVPAGYALMVPDLPGCGQSWGAPGQCQLEEALEALELCQDLLAQQTRELPRFLFGHGTGALMALEYLLTRPASQSFYHAVLISSPYLRQRREPSDLRFKLWDLLAKVLPSRTCRLRLPADCLTDDRRVLMDREQDNYVHDRCSCGLRVRLHELGARLAQEAPGLPLPLLMMYGGAEQWLSLPSLRDFARQLPEYMNSIEWPHFLFDLHNMQDRRSYFDTVIEYLELCLQRGLQVIPQAREAAAEQLPADAVGESEEAFAEGSEAGPEQGTEGSEALEELGVAAGSFEAIAADDALDAYLDGPAGEGPEEDGGQEEAAVPEYLTEGTQEEDELFPSDWARRHAGDSELSAEDSHG